MWVEKPRLGFVDPRTKTRGRPCAKFVTGVSRKRQPVLYCVRIPLYVCLLANFTGYKLFYKLTSNIVFVFIIRQSTIWHLCQNINKVLWSGKKYWSLDFFCYFQDCVVKNQPIPFFLLLLLSLFISMICVSYIEANSPINLNLIIYLYVIKNFASL